MSRASRSNALELRGSAVLLGIFGLLVAVGIAGCKKQAPQQAQQNVQRYHLAGTIVSVNKDRNSLVVDGQAVPGFMSAMTMTYSVRDAHLLNGLAPGDKIAADIVIGGNGPYLDHIVVAKKATGAKP